MSDDIDLEKENRALREELAQARMELRRLDQLKRDFISIAAHELRSPLTILLGYAKILESEATGAERERAEIVVSHAWQLKHLVDTMFILQQLDTGEFALRFEAVPVHEVIENVIISQRNAVAEKQLRIEAVYEPDLLVRADRERLALVMANLLSNAIKYSPQGDLVTIKTRSERAQAIISVQDNGIGILSEEQPHVFERFYQVGSPFTRHYKGPGLGLAVSKEIVELHGGRIWVESIIDQGSTFNVSLPRILPDSNQFQASETHPTMVF
jgi:two-component system sensor histidine kinase VicK